MDDKKRKEYYFLLNFKAIYPDFPLGEIEPSESPDFLIREMDKIIGIEMVSFYQDHTNNELIELRDIIQGKEEKVAKYIEKCDFIWLLIVAEGYHSYQTANFKQVKIMMKRMKTSVFHKVIFFDYKEMKYNEWPEKTKPEECNEF